MDPVGILQAITEYLNEHKIQGEQMMDVTIDSVEGDDNEAEVRISWGGRDLFDLTIKRI